MNDRREPHGLLLSEDSLLLTCAKLHVHKIVEDNGEAPRQEWVDHTPPLQVLGTGGDIKNSRGPRPDSLPPRVLTAPHPNSIFRARKELQMSF